MSIPGSKGPLRPSGKVAKWYDVNWFTTLDIGTGIIRVGTSCNLFVEVSAPQDSDVSSDVGFFSDIPFTVASRL